jgi:DeoR/GlpR family transcriptional regulator of sugar metabolism
MSESRPRAASRRQSDLLAWIRAQGQVDVAGLAGQFGVSPETLRRDLRALESQGTILRAYGTAQPAESGAFETGLRERSDSHVAEKERIAVAAVARLGEAQTLYIDEGFNPSLVAQRLPADRPLTVVTPSLPIATILAARANIKPIILGGRVRANTLGVADDWASEMLSRLTIDLAIIGANGVTIDRGMSTPDPAVAVVKRAAVKASIRRIFIGAHSKFGLDSFVRFADVTDFEVLITGRELSVTRAQAFRSAGTPVVRV